MSPRHIDPLARARDFPSMPAPWRQERSLEREVAALQSKYATAIDLATQPQANTRIERVTALPEPTSSDIDRQILLQLPGEFLTSIYIGVLLPDSTIEWQLMGEGVEVDDGGATSPEYSFAGHVSSYGVGFGPRKLTWLNNDILSTHATGISARKYNVSTGSLTVWRSGEPSPTSVPAEGLAYRTVAQGSIGASFGIPDIWASVPDNHVRFSTTNTINGNAIDFSSSPARNYRGLVYDYLDNVVVAVVGGAGDIVRLNSNTGIATINTPITTGLLNPRGIAMAADGTFFVVDTGNSRVRKYTHAFAAGTPLSWGSAGSADGQFSNPLGIAVDASNRVYVVDNGNNRVQVFDANGNFLGKFGSFGTGSGEFDAPEDILVKGADIWVSDFGNDRLSRWLRTVE